MWQSIQRNWKTNVVALIAFVYTVPQAVTCVQEWVGHQHCDYRSTVLGLLLAVGAAAAKDSSNHSTAQEIAVSTTKVNPELTSNITENSLPQQQQQQNAQIDKWTPRFLGVKNDIPK